MLPAQPAQGLGQVDKSPFQLGFVGGGQNDAEALAGGQPEFQEVATHQDRTRRTGRYLRFPRQALEPQQALEVLMDRMKGTKSNAEFLLMVQKTSPGA